MKTKNIFNFISAINLIGLISVIVFTSCSNENLNDLNPPEEINNQSIEIMGKNVAIEDKTLSFENESDFKNLIYQIKNQKSVSTRQNAVVNYSLTTNKSLSIDGFQSLYEIYEEALKVSESYYEREGGYEEFKEIYDCLYFPEYKDDYSAYLPVSDSDLAKILSPKGEVIIGGIVKNMKDINSYEQLRVLGLSIPDIDNIDKEETKDMVSRVTTRTTKQVTLTENEVYTENKRKIWIDIQPNTNYNHPYIVRFDIAFRKKGFLGAWYNHSAVTDFTLTCDSKTYGYYWMRDGKSGSSSHNYYFDVVGNLSDPVENLHGNVKVNYDALANIWFTLYFNNQNVGIPG